MKRYTARLRTVDDTLDAAQIKRVIEAELLRHPITFKLGAIAPAENEVVLVEVASDLKRADLARILRGVESTRRLQIEGVGWGWLVTGATGKKDDRDSDPYASAQAQAEEAKEYTGKTRWIAVRQGVGCLFLIGWVSVLLSAILNWMEFRYMNAIVWVLYLGLFLSGASFNPRTFFAYVSRIRCDRDGIEVEYWLRPTPRRKAWSEIQTMEIGALGLNLACTLRASKDSLSFLAEELNERPKLIKTITERASLHFVEGMIGRTVYKRFNAD